MHIDSVTSTTHQLVFFAGFSLETLLLIHKLGNIFIMKFAIAVSLALVFCSVLPNKCLTAAAEAGNDDNTKAPTVLIVTLFRNKALVLPYFFSYLESLDYPKDRITLW